MTVVLEGVYELPNPINLQPSVVGVESKVKIGGVEGTCSLPVFDSAPPDHFERLQPPASARMGLSEEINWGIPWSFPSRHSAVASVYLRFPVEVDTSDHQAQIDRAGAVEASIDDWFSRLCDWIEVFTGQDLAPHDPLRSGRMEGRGLLLRCRDELTGHWSVVSPQHLVAYASSELPRVPCSAG